MPYLHSHALSGLTPIIPSKNHPILLPVPSSIALMASTFSADHLKWRCCCRIPTWTIFVSSAVICSSKAASRYISARGPEGMWEDPDDGSESESEDEEEEEEVKERDLDFKSDWEEETLGSSLSAAASMDRPHDDDDDDDYAAEYEDILATEVEQLLEPKERAILRRNGAPNLDKISTGKWKPLHTVALSGQVHYLDRLLENGVEIDSHDKDGHTALHIAVIGKKEPVISHLLRKGANPHIRDGGGATALHYAVQVGALQTVKLLIKYGADVNVSDDDGWTPLHVAMQTRDRNITKVLLVNGADKSRKNKDGKTPLDLCLAYGKEFKSYDLAKLLKVMPSS